MASLKRVPDSRRPRTEEKVTELGPLFGRTRSWMPSIGSRARTRTPSGLAISLLLVFLPATVCHVWPWPAEESADSGRGGGNALDVSTLKALLLRGHPKEREVHGGQLQRRTLCNDATEEEVATSISTTTFSSLWPLLCLFHDCAQPLTSSAP